MSDDKSIWEYVEDGYDAFTNLFGDDVVEQGIRAGYDYLTQDDQSSSGTKLKRLRGRVGIKTAGMAPPGATKAPGSRVSSQYEVVYSKYNSIFKSAIASAKATTVRRRA
tara:strand:- start:75 stop:401 length:327 start_codon:yes stop_codon:yes gene_type:complete